MDWKSADIGLVGKYWKQILFVLGGVLILYAFLWVSTRKPQIPAEYKRTIDSLTNLNIELIKRQDRIDSTLGVYEQKVDEVDFQIDNIKEKTTIVREYYHEISQQASNYNTAQVDSFLKARYNY